MNKFFSLKELKSSKWLYIIWPYLALLVIHIIFVAQAQQPWLWPDEYKQLSQAMFFSGGEHLSYLSTSTYPHFGYAFLITPAFWLFSDPGHIYKTIVIINAIFASALYFPIYYLIRKLFSVEKKIATLISIITCLYPAFVVQSMIAWQDSVVFTFYATSVALLYYFLQKNNYLSIVLFSSSVGYLYMMHVRALPVLILTVLFLIVLSYKKKLRKKITVGLLVVIIFYVITNLFNQFIINVAGYDNNSIRGAWEVFLRIKNSNGLLFLSRIFGQLLYLIQATYGLFLFGLIYLLKCIWGNRKNIFKDKKIITLVYLFITATGLFISSAIFNSVPNLSRPDKLIYGRYNELFLALFISLGLVSFYYKKNKERYYLLLVGIVLIASFLVELEPTQNGIIVPMSVVGISIWFFLFSRIYIFLFSAIVLFVILLLKRINTKNFYYSLFLLFVLFGLNIAVYYSSYSNLNKSYSRSNNLIEGIKNIKDREIDYIEDSFCKNSSGENMSILVDYNIYNFQWQLPEKKFNLINTKRGDFIKNKYAIASLCWDAPEEAIAEVIEVDNFGAQAIWKVEKKNE